MLRHVTRAAFARRSSTIAIASTIFIAGTAIAQDQPAAAPPQADQETADIVVTGFRASLDSALGMKRQEAAAIDSIVAEDIGKFPDSNLAESMQRVPGIALARGDGGEGRNISVRGLGAGFTRVRINGMEGTSQTGSSDIYGAGNNGRSFDFNVFPTEIFSALSVRKTTSADVEEGSLGATVDLSAPKPMDQKEDFVLSMTARGVYNELSKKVDPRASLLISKQFGDSGFGILGSLAYQKRNIREVGYSAVDILSANTNGGFCSPVGFAPQNPSTNAAKGADALNCSTGNPRTSTNGAYQAIVDLRRDDLPNVAGSGAFLPRIPRYLNSEQDQERIGGSLTLQFKPDDETDISLDFLYSRFEVTRRDNYIAAISFARSAANNGQPMTSVRDIEFDENGSLVYGLFDGVDVRSEGLVDHFVSTFKQANLNFKRQLSDNLEVSGIVGFNRSIWDGKKRLQTFIDAIDTDGFSIDYRDGGSTPVLGFGIDVNNPASFTYAPGLADGTVLGGFSYQGKPSKNTTDNMTAEANLKWSFSDAFSIRAGAQYRRSDFLSTFLRPYSADLLVRALPAGTSLADITTTISGVDKLWGKGAPSSWVAIDADKWADTFGFDSVRYCGVECGAGRSRVREEVMSSYIMANFDLEDAIGFGVRGDVGVRYVKTDMVSSGYITVANAASPTGLAGQFASAKNGYDDWLPSANVVIEPIDNLLVRVSGAKVLARPELGLLTPTSGVNPVTRVGNVNNPFLDPIRATTFDLAVEWYFRPGSLLSAAFFYKDIKSFIQNVNSQIPFNQLGLPDALLIGSNTLPTELFTVSQPFNTPGGPLKGIELNAQIPFTFFDGFLANFGVLANYTKVTSKIDYILASVNGVPTVTTTADLVGLSKNTASATLYYEDDKFSIRSTGNFRDKFIRGIPASPGSDLQGNAKTFYMDASASYNVTDRLKIIVEAQNLTDEQNRLYIDSQRQDTLFETRIGRTFTFGVTYRM
ncbi:MAG TPA: TonB-dependent receptor [Sphingobium sp.]|jgi:TonB-dependent receptor|uniref:TonB-dependent receptor n=1 Tax=unclassified Sphingobium TaxID=2611147 RepID=UPI000ECEB66A|nr:MULTISPECIES: TonB-dependent receptor [unclassified Sphingobium]WIW88213.1 TonB-dependent receptor [Sphingobium sp. V4]HAF43192.1 TonB-dependent receptor [Sphingobium sp.]